MRGNYGARDDEMYHQHVYPGEFYPTDEDSIFHLQMHDMNHLGNPINALNNFDNPEDAVQRMEIDQIAHFEEMERMRLLEDMQQINQFEEINRMRELEQLQEVNEMQQMDQFEQLHRRRQRINEIAPRTTPRRLMQKDFTSELEFIDKPEFSKRALPKYYNSTRTVDIRRCAAAQDDIHHRRSRDVGRVGGKDDIRRDAIARRTRSTSPSRRSTRQRDKLGRDHSIRSRARDSSKTRSHRNMVPHGHRLSQDKRDPDKKYSRRDVRETDESSCDESWNRVATPGEMLAGLMEKDGWLNQATGVFKGTLNTIFNDESEISSYDETSDGESSTGDDESRFESLGRKRY